MDTHDKEMEEYKKAMADWADYLLSMNIKPACRHDYRTTWLDDRSSTVLYCIKCDQRIHLDKLTIKGIKT